MSIIDNRIIELNSHYSQQLNDTMLSSVFFPIPNLLKPSRDIVRTYVSCQNAVIPVSFYIINETNRKIQLKDKDGHNTTNIQITMGNYTASSLIQELTSQINAVFVHHVSISFNKLTGKLTFNFADIVSIQGGGATTMWNIIGTNNQTIQGQSIVMPYPLSLLGIKKLQIRSNALDISSFDSQTGTATNTLATISVNQAYFGLISYVPTYETKYLLSTDQLDGIDISITDENNQLINFNGQDWAITFLLSVERIPSVTFNDDITMVATKQLDLTQIQPLTSDQSSQPQLAVERMQHDVHEPETFSESMKQYSEAMLKGTSNYTQQFRDLIREFGDNVITKMVVKRSPVRKMVVKTLDIISLGKWEKLSPYDTLWHLYVSLTMDNGVVLRLEKNSVLSLRRSAGDDDNTETMDIQYPIDSYFTLNTLLERTRERMGKKYFLYNAKGNNCQMFIRDMLQANGLGNEEELKFIMQDTRAIFNQNPDYLRRVALFTTNLRAGMESTSSQLKDIIRHRTDLFYLTR